MHSIPSNCISNFTLPRISIFIFLTLLIISQQPQHLVYALRNGPNWIHTTSADLHGISNGIKHLPISPSDWLPSGRDINPQYSAKFSYCIRSPLQQIPYLTYICAQEDPNNPGLYIHDVTWNSCGGQPFIGPIDISLAVDCNPICPLQLPISTTPDEGTVPTNDDIMWISQQSLCSLSSFEFEWYDEDDSDICTESWSPQMNITLACTAMVPVYHVDETSHGLQRVWIDPIKCLHNIETQIGQPLPSQLHQQQYLSGKGFGEYIITLPASCHAQCTTTTSSSYPPEELVDCNIPGRFTTSISNNECEKQIDWRLQSCEIRADVAQDQIWFINAPTPKPCTGDGCPLPNVQPCLYLVADYDDTQPLITTSIDDLIVLEQSFKSFNDTLCDKVYTGLLCTATPLPLQDVLPGEVIANSRDSNSTIPTQCQSYSYEQFMIDFQQKDINDTTNTPIPQGWFFNDPILFNSDICSTTQNLNLTHIAAITTPRCATEYNIKTTDERLWIVLDPVTTPECTTPLSFPTNLTFQCQPKIGCTKDIKSNINTTLVTTNVDFTCGIPEYELNEDCEIYKGRGIRCFQEITFVDVENNINNNDNSSTDTIYNTIWREQPLRYCPDVYDIRNAYKVFQQQEIDTWNNIILNTHDDITTSRFYTQFTTEFDSANCSEEYTWYCISDRSYDSLNTLLTSANEGFVDNSIWYDLINNFHVKPCVDIQIPTLLDILHGYKDNDGISFQIDNIWDVSSLINLFSGVNGNINDITEIYTNLTISKIVPFCISHAISNIDNTTPVFRLVNLDDGDDEYCGTNPIPISDFTTELILPYAQRHHGCVPEITFPNINIQAEVDIGCRDVEDILGIEGISTCPPVHKATIACLAQIGDNQDEMDDINLIPLPLALCGELETFNQIVLQHYGSNTPNPYHDAIHNSLNLAYNWTLLATPQQDDCIWDWECTNNIDTTPFGTCDYKTNQFLTDYYCQTRCNESWPDETFYCVSNKLDINGKPQVDITGIKCMSAKPIITAYCPCEIQCSIDKADLTSNPFGDCNMNLFKNTTICGGVHTRDIILTTHVTDLLQLTYDDCLESTLYAYCDDLFSQFSTTQYQTKEQIIQTCPITAICAPPGTPVDDELSIYDWSSCSTMNDDTEQLWGFSSCIEHQKCGLQNLMTRIYTCSILTDNLPLLEANLTIGYALDNSPQFTDLSNEQRDVMKSALNRACVEQIPTPQLTTQCDCTPRYLCLRNSSLIPDEWDQNVYGSCGDDDGEEMNDVGDDDESHEFVDHELFGFDNCPKLCHFDQRNLTRDIYCYDKDGRITPVTEEEPGVCGEVLQRYPITSKICNGDVLCNATYVCNTYQSNQPWGHDILSLNKTYVSCDNDEWWSDTCYYKQDNVHNTLFIEETCVPEDDIRQFYRQRDVQCLAYTTPTNTSDGDIYIPLPEDLLFPIEVPNNNNTNNSIALCEYITQYNNITKPSTYIRDIEFGDDMLLCKTQEGCIPQIWDLKLSTNIAQEGEQVEFTWKYQGPIANTQDYIHFEYALTEENLLIDFPLLKWMDLPIHNTNSTNNTTTNTTTLADLLLIKNKKYIWTIPKIWNDGIYMGKPEGQFIFIRAKVKTIQQEEEQQHPILFVNTTLSSITTSQQSTTIISIVTNYHVLIKLTPTCPLDYKCIGNNVKDGVNSCIMKLDNKSNQYKPECQCYQPLTFSPLAHQFSGSNNELCERSTQCDAIVGCKNNGFYGYDYIGGHNQRTDNNRNAHNNNNCDSKCTCPFLHTNDDCTECTQSCVRSQGRPIVNILDPATGNGCTCQSCYIGYWGDFCEYCQKDLILNILQPSTYSLYYLQQESSSHIYNVMIVTLLQDIIKNVLNINNTNNIIIEIMNNKNKDNPLVIPNAIQFDIKIRGECGNNTHTMNNNNNNNNNILLNTLSNKNDDIIPTLTHNHLNNIINNIKNNNTLWSLLSSSIGQQNFSSIELQEIVIPSPPLKCEAEDQYHPLCVVESPPLLENRKKSIETTTIIAVVVSVSVVLIICIIIVFFCCKFRYAILDDDDNNARRRRGKISKSDSNINDSLELI